MSKLKIRYFARPGRKLSDPDLAALHAGIRRVGERSLDPLPEYQVLVGGRDAYADKIVTVAYLDGEICAFSAAVLLPVEGVGTVLHLGLTCVDPGTRGYGLTHKLVSRLMLRYLVTSRPLGRLWISNVANVLSSLGNFALVIPDAHPSPSSPRPNDKATLVARAFEAHYRDVAFVQPAATFDEAAFVFRGSGKDTTFHKDGDDAQFFHRDRSLTDFYRGQLRFEDGDEMLQVGTLRLWDLVRYARGRGR